MVQNNQPGEAETFRTTQYRYDSMNNVIASIGENGETDQVVQYQYDNRNLMTGMITGLTAYSENTVEGALTQYAYDSYGRLQKTTDPMGMETNYSYDYLGNQTGAADRNGNQTTMQYGVFGMTRMTVTGEGKSERTENSYNNLGQATEKKLYENNALTDQASYTYDAFGRVTKETENGRTKEYAYDENSNVISFQLKQGSMVKNEVTYDYNSYDWLVSLISGGTEVSYAYDVNGNLKLRAMGTYRTWYDYNKANLPVRMENEDVFKDVYQEYHYTYGLDGNKLTDTQTGGIAKAYTYDGLGRLSNETVTNGEHTDRMSYVYDAFGNRQSMTVEGSENYTANYRYDLNNRLLSATKNMGDNKQEITNYRYDNNGNELFRHTMTYTDTGTYDINVNHDNNGFTVSEYNLMGQVTRVNSDKAEAKYSYNVSGLRKSKTVNDETTNFIWNGQNMVAEAGDNDIIQNTYTYDVTGVLLRNDTDWYLKNAHGDVVGMTDSRHNLMKEYRYDAFGNEIGKDANDMNPFRYCGEYYDSETENIYLRARYYNPADGRFVSEDPIKDGLNWYGYCSGNPVMFVDPSGMLNTGYDENGVWHDWDAEKYGEDSIVYKALSYLTDAWNAFEEYRADIEELANEVRYLADENGAGVIDNIIGGLQYLNLLPDNLNYVEQVLIAGYPLAALSIDDARDEADEATWEIFGESGNGDGEANAFKHSYWNAVATDKVGEKMTRLFTNAHEFGWVWENVNNIMPMKMDLHNNSVGRMIGGSELYKNNIRNGVMMQLISGGLRKVENGMLVQTNANTQYLPRN